MIRLLLLVASAALMTYAQAASKPVPAETANTATPSTAERPLTETEILKFKLASAEIQLLQKEFKIEEYQSKIKPIISDQESIATTACLSVGVPADKVKSECGLNLGGPGPDGKPTPSKVWWNKPQAVSPVFPGGSGGAPPSAEKK